MLVKKFLITALFIVFFSSSAFSTLSYEGTFGIKPLPEKWNNTGKVAVNTFRITFTPSLSLSNWPFQVVTKYPYSWGTPTNPAENVFYLQEELPEFLKLEFSLVSNGFCLFISIPIQKEFQNRLKTLETMHNVPFDFSIDLNFPHEAYLYYAKDIFFVSVGRFKLSWGDARYPVQVSPVTSFDNLTFSIKFENVLFTFHAIPSYPLLTPEEYKIQKEYSDQHTKGLYFYEPSKYIFAHRLDFYKKFGGDFTFRLGIGEISVVGGKFPDLIDLSPAIFYHNTYGEGYSNISGGADFSLTYKDRVKFYGELVFDDLISLTEVGSNYKPGAFAYNVGVNLKFENQEIWFEYARTSEWMYVTNYLPYLRINVRKFYIQNFPPARFLVDYPLGFVYGPDARMISFGFEGSLGNANYSIEYNYLVKGLVNDNGKIRWKWFWDGWQGNVSEPGASTPEKTGEGQYHLVTGKFRWKNVYLLYRTVDFKNHYLGLALSYEW